VKANRTKNLALITSRTLIVGVDGHCKSNTAAFCMANGDEPVRPFTFGNDRHGFLRFLERVDWVKKRKGLSSAVFVLEPNGPYWRLLGRFLSERNHLVRVVNPLQVKMNRQTGNPSQDKTDFADARSVADLGKQGKFNQTTLLGAVYEDLRSLTGLREALIGQRSALKHRLRAALVRTFPELDSLVSDILGKGVRALLRVSPTAKGLAGLGVEAVTEVLKEASRGRFGQKKAKQIVFAARDSVGYAAQSLAVRIEFEALLDSIEGLSANIERVEWEMARLLRQTEEGLLLTSVPGIGEVTAAAILGETGSLKHYQNPNQIRKLAGFDLVGNQSGSRQTDLRISKRGRKLLRKIFYQAAVASLRCNDPLIRFYKGLIDPGRDRTLKKKQAIVAVAGKLIDIVFSLVKTRDPFELDHEWIAPGGQKRASEAMAA